MPEQYLVERRNEENGLDAILIHDLPNCHTLEIMESEISQQYDSNDAYLAKVVPFADYEKVRFRRWNTNIPITGRNLGEYFMNMLPGQCDYPSGVARKLADKFKGKNIIEIGPGIGEFLPHVASLNSSVKPIGVDSADYSVIKNMLSYAVTNKVSEKRQALLEEMLKRAQTITDPSKVHLFNTTFDNFLKENPGIEGTFDLLIDNNGISVSPTTRLSRRYSNEQTEQGIMTKLLNDYLMLLKRGGIMALGKSDTGYIEIQKPSL